MPSGTGFRFVPERRPVAFLKALRASSVKFNLIYQFDMGCCRSFMAGGIWTFFRYEYRDVCIETHALNTSNRLRPEAQKRTAKLLRPDSEKAMLMINSTVPAAIPVHFSNCRHNFIFDDVCECLEASPCKFAYTYGGDMFCKHPVACRDRKQGEHGRRAFEYAGMEHE